MNDQTASAISRARLDASDEHDMLNALLLRLEHSDNLSLDELDAIILQADAAYRNRLARLERTRQLIDRLGKPS
ncbi:MAG: hypothetical protein H7244_07450 [Herminiimonas sp.]|nr:hypothetical protein [Herminiimonas sp.]